MNFRQFVEQVKDAAQAGAQGLRGQRDLTPFLHLESTGSRVSVFPVDPLFFADEAAQGRLVVATLELIDSYNADKVGWTFTGIERDEAGDEAILTALVLDREVEECWTAPIIRGVREDDIPVLGGWTLTGRNTGAGLLVNPIQEALRR